MPRLLELFCGAKSIGRATILCDIRSWDYALFPPGHFDMVWASPVCADSRALTMRPRRLEEGRAGAQSPRDHGALRPAHVGHRESGHRAAEDPPVHGGLRTGSRPDCGPTCGDQAEGCAGAAVGATCGRTGGIGGALKGGLDSWGVSVRGSRGSRASCFTAFRRRCARRLKRGAFLICNELIFFLSRHGIAPLPEDCASALWAGLAADAAPIYLPRHSQQERVAPQLQLLQSARGIFDQQPRSVQAGGSLQGAIQHLRSRGQGQLTRKSPLVSALRCPSEGSGASQLNFCAQRSSPGSLVITQHPSFVR